MQKSVIILIAVTLILGCSSVPLRIPGNQCMLPKENYEVIGQGEGSATGIMLFNFIPIGQNDRFVNAYNGAVNSMGGDCLIDAQISESWFWAYVLNGYSTTIKGTVVKLKKKVPSEKVTSE